MPETQPKVGHLEEVSVNDTDKTGRPLITETQPKVGHLEEVSTNDEGRGGSEPPRGGARGYDGTGDGLPNPRRIDDKVKPAKGGEY